MNGQPNTPPADSAGDSTSDSTSASVGASADGAERTVRTVVVTGGAGGIGYAIASVFAEGGDHVVLVDYSETVAAAAANLGGTGVRVDLSDHAAAKAVVDHAISATGSLDVLVNAAGIQVRTAAIDIVEDDWQRLLDVNLSAAYRLTRASAKALASVRGSIINVLSLSSDRAVPGIVPYGATKGGLLQLTKGLAAELGAQGIRVNAVAPGYVVTPMTAPVLDDPAFRERALSRIPLGRLAEPADVADVVRFLASTDARYVTGTVIPVDGGYAIT